MDSAADRIRDELVRVTGHSPRWTGGQWMSRCPGHEDRTPSLAVRQIEGQALVYCHAGCRTEDVLAALDLSIRDLYDEPRGDHLTTYTYTDAAGQPTRTVHRLAGKNFRQSGDKRVAQLYRLPRVIAAVTAGAPVYLVEGEKDVHALESLDVVATTGPQGAKNFGQVDVAPLKGAHVVAVADRDGPGAKWAAIVRERLDGYAASLRLVEAAAGKDAADHIAAGLGVSEFTSLDAPSPTASRVTLVSLAEVTRERIDWLWPGYLARGKLHVVDGDPGLGKSSVTTDLAARITSGKPWPDGQPGCTPGGVVLLSAEDGLGDTIRPRLEAAGAELERVMALTAVNYRDKDHDEMAERLPSLPSDIPRVREAVERVGAVLLVVDPLMAYLGGDVNSHRDQDVRRALAPLAKMAEETGTAIVLVRHLSKGGGSNAVYRGGGSIGIIGAARIGFTVARDPEDATRVIVACTKANITMMPASLAYRLVDSPEFGCARVEWEDGPVSYTAEDLLHAAGESADDRADRNDAADWLRGYLADNGGEAEAVAVFKAGDKIGLSRDALKRAKRRAGVSTRKAGFDAGWMWVLDDEGSTKGAKSAGPETLLPSLPSVLPSSCQVCDQPLDPAVIAGGFTTHPGCDS